MLQMGQHLFLSSPLLPSCLLSCTQNHRTAEAGRHLGTAPCSAFLSQERTLRHLRKQNKRRHSDVRLEI